MTRGLQIGVLLLNAFVLALEIAITRIFSVTMFYHFAFLAIGVALFGFGASGVVLYIAEKRFRGGNLGVRLGGLCMWAGLTTIISLVIALNVDFDPHGSLAAQFFKLAGIYLATSVPFFFAGLALALLFQRLSDHIPRLYLLSLVGSALGCLVIVPLLQFAGGPGAFMIIAGIAYIAVAGFNFGTPEAGGTRNHQGHQDTKIGTEPKKTMRPRSTTVILAVIIAIALILAGILNPRMHIIDVKYTKGRTIDPSVIVFDRWNAFSRIVVLNLPNPLAYYEDGIHNWGISEEWRLDEQPFPDQLWLEIDNTAGTPITRFSGEPEELEIARYDVTAAAHYLLDRPHVLVVGPGGGKDILAALAFDASRVDGAEINPLIGEVMRRTFAGFNGNIYTRDPVNVVVSEGRTFIARSRDKYDLLQISLIDTWAAASTGAYALSENNLYTIEAFEEYFDHLAPNGIYSMSRFAFDPPRETLKVVSIARAALDKRGVEDPGRCVMVIKQGIIANVMVRPDGFDDEAVRTMQEKCDDLGYEILYLPDREPQSGAQSHYHDLLTTTNPGRFIAQYDLDIRPTTDDRPFFFYLVPPWKFMEAFWFGKTYREGYNSIAVFTLVSLLIISLVVVLVFIVLPLLLFRRADIRQEGDRKLKLLGYFICLGLSFILIEIALMQHFTLFLGYPIYSLAAVLMSLLLFSGFGSGWSGRIPPDRLEIGIRSAVIGIGLVALVYIFALPPIFTSLIVLPDFLRIIIAIALVFPLGWFMGQPFPLGLRIIEREKLGVIPWAWGVNGAASVLGSALALTLAIALGYRWTLFVGIGVYLAAWAVVANLKRKNPN